MPNEQKEVIYNFNTYVVLEKEIDPTDKVFVNIDAKATKAFLNHENNKDLSALSAEDLAKRERVSEILSKYENNGFHKFNVGDLDYLENSLRTLRVNTSNNNPDVQNIHNALFNTSTTVNNAKILNEKFLDNYKEVVRNLIINPYITTPIEPTDKFIVRANPENIESIKELLKENMSVGDFEIETKNSRIINALTNNKDGAVKIRHEDLAHLEKMLTNSMDTSNPSDPKTKMLGQLRHETITHIDNARISNKRLLDSEQEQAPLVPKKKALIDDGIDFINPKEEIKSILPKQHVEAKTTVAIETPKQATIEPEKVSFKSQTQVLKAVEHELREIRHARSAHVGDYGKKEGNIANDIAISLRKGSTEFNVEVESLPTLKEALKKIITDNEFANGKYKEPLPTTHKGIQKLLIECNEKMEWAMNIAETLKNKVLNKPEQIQEEKNQNNSRLKI